MSAAVLIAATLERSGAASGALTDRIYTRLFDLHPEFEALFVMDTDGGVRRSMLTSSLNCILGVARNEARTAHYLIEAARMIHDGYGIRGEEVDAMFVAIRDVVRADHGANWTPDMDSAWMDLLEELARIGSAAA